MGPRSPVDRGRKVVYCHTPARWLYQSDRYLAGSARWSAAVLRSARPPLRRWDQRAAASADRYLVNSTAVRQRVSELYGIDADVVPPAVDVGHGGPVERCEGWSPATSCACRACCPTRTSRPWPRPSGALPDQRLVVVGTGPLHDRLAASAPANVTMPARSPTAGFAGCMPTSVGLVAASYEDFGLTPLEAASFGKPTAALRWGGFLDTTVEGRHRRVLRPSRAGAHRGRRPPPDLGGLGP